MAAALGATSGVLARSVRVHESPIFNLLSEPAHQFRLTCHRRVETSTAWTRASRRKTGVRAMDAAVGGGGEEREAPRVFPRIGVRDPYKRLGLRQDASTEEIQDARSFLIEEFSGHEKSTEAIEAAYDTIIAQKFSIRKKTKINLKADLKKRVDESPGWVKTVLGRFAAPAGSVIAQRFVLFALLGAWSIANPSEGGPAFQVAVALAACVYLLNVRVKSLGRSCLYGFVTLVIGWVAGSLVVPFLPVAILPRFWSLELGTALVAYVFLWFTTTFAK